MHVKMSQVCVKCWIMIRFIGKTLLLVNSYKSICNRFDQQMHTNS